MTVFVPSEAMAAYLKNAVKVAEAIAEVKDKTEIIFAPIELCKEREK